MGDYKPRLSYSKVVRGKELMLASAQRIDVRQATWDSKQIYRSMRKTSIPLWMEFSTCHTFCLRTRKVSGQSDPRIGSESIVIGSHDTFSAQGIVWVICAGILSDAVRFCGSICPIPSPAMQYIVETSCITTRYDTVLYISLSAILVAQWIPRQSTANGRSVRLAYAVHENAVLAH